MPQPVIPEGPFSFKQVKMTNNLEKFLYICIMKNHNFANSATNTPTAEDAPHKKKRHRVYDSFMLFCILISIVPLMFIRDHIVFRYLEAFSVTVFIYDYLWRWHRAERSLRHGKLSYLIYPFTPMAIIDLLSILPVLHLISPSFKLFRLTRMLKIVRVFKIFRYSDKISVFMRVLQKERDVLLSVLMLAVCYIFITALVMFNAEPYINPQTGESTFNSFFDALYWATVTLTTVGYGDLCPVTSLGRFISMLSSLFGVAIIALPSGVITAGYMDEMKEQRRKRHKGKEDKTATDTGARKNSRSPQAEARCGQAEQESATV